MMILLTAVCLSILCSSVADAAFVIPCSFFSPTVTVTPAMIAAQAAADRSVTLQGCQIPLSVNFTEGSASNLTISISNSIIPILFMYDVVQNTSVSIIGSSTMTGVAQLDASPCYVCVVAVQVDGLWVSVVSTNVSLQQTAVSVASAKQRAFILWSPQVTSTSLGLVPFVRRLGVSLSTTSMTLVSTNDAATYLGDGTLGALLIFGGAVDGPVSVTIMANSQVTSYGNWSMNPLVYSRYSIGLVTVHVVSSEVNVTGPTLFLFNDVTSNVSVRFDTCNITWRVPRSIIIPNPSVMLVLGNSTQYVNDNISIQMTASNFQATELASASTSMMISVGSSRRWSWVVMDSIIVGVDQVFSFATSTQDVSLRLYGSTVAFPHLVMCGATLSDVSIVLAGGTITLPTTSTRLYYDWAYAPSIYNVTVVVSGPTTVIQSMMGVQGYVVMNTTVRIELGATVNLLFMSLNYGVSLISAGGMVTNCLVDVSGTGTVVLANASIGFPYFFSIPAGFISSLYGLIDNSTVMVRQGATMTIRGGDALGAITSLGTGSRLAVHILDSATFVVNGPSSTLIGIIGNMSGGALVVIRNQSVVRYLQAVDRAPTTPTGTTPGGTLLITNYHSALVMAKLVQDGVIITIAENCTVWTEFILFAYVVDSAMITIDGGSESDDNTTITLFGSIATLQGSTANVDDVQQPGSSSSSDDRLAIAIGRGVVIDHRSTKPWCIFKNSVSFLPTPNNVNNASVIGPASLITLEGVRVHITGAHIILRNTSVGTNQSASNGLWWRSIAYCPINSTKYVEEGRVPQPYWNITIINVTMFLDAPPAIIGGSSLSLPLIAFPFALVNSTVVVSNLAVSLNTSAALVPSWAATVGPQLRISGGILDDTHFMCSNIVLTNSLGGGSSTSWSLDVTPPADGDHFWWWWQQRGGSTAGVNGATQWIAFSSVSITENNTASSVHLTISNANLLSSSGTILLYSSGCSATTLQLTNTNVSNDDVAVSSDSATPFTIAAHPNDDDPSMLLEPVSISLELRNTSVVASASLISIDIPGNSNVGGVSVTATLAGSTVEVLGSLVSMYTGMVSNSSINTTLVLTNRSMLEVADMDDSATASPSPRLTTTAVFNVAADSSSTMSAFPELHCDVTLLGASQLQIGSSQNTTASLRAVSVFDVSASQDSTTAQLFISARVGEWSSLTVEGAPLSVASAGAIAAVATSNTTILLNVSHIQLQVTNASRVAVVNATTAVSTALMVAKQTSASGFFVGVPVVVGGGSTQQLTSCVDATIHSVVVADGSLLVMSVVPFSTEEAQQDYVNMVNNMITGAVPLTGAFMLVLPESKDHCPVDVTLQVANHSQLTLSSSSMISTSVNVIDGSAIVYVSRLGSLGATRVTIAVLWGSDLSVAATPASSSNVSSLVTLAAFEWLWCAQDVNVPSSTSSTPAGNTITANITVEMSSQITLHVIPTTASQPSSVASLVSVSERRTVCVSPASKTLAALVAQVAVNANTGGVVMISTEQSPSSQLVAMPQMKCHLVAVSGPPGTPMSVLGPVSIVANVSGVVNLSLCGSNSQTSLLSVSGVAVSSTFTAALHIADSSHVHLNCGSGVLVGDITGNSSASSSGVAVTIGGGTQAWLGGPLLDIWNTFAGTSLQAGTGLSISVFAVGNTTISMSNLSSVSSSASANVVSVRNATIDRIDVIASQQGQRSTFLRTSGGASPSAAAVVSLVQDTIVTNEMRLSGGVWVLEHMVASAPALAMSPLTFGVQIGDRSMARVLNMTDMIFESRLVTSLTTAAPTSRRALQELASSPTTTYVWAPVAVNGLPPSRSTMMGVAHTDTIMSDLALNASSLSGTSTNMYVVAFSNASIMAAWSAANIAYSTTFGCSTAASATTGAVLWDSPSCFPATSSVCDIANITCRSIIIRTPSPTTTQSSTTTASVGPHRATPTQNKTSSSQSSSPPCSKSHSTWTSTNSMSHGASSSVSATKDSSASRTRSTLTPSGMPSTISTSMTLSGHRRDITSRTATRPPALASSKTLTASHAAPASPPPNTTPAPPTDSGLAAADNSSSDTVGIAVGASVGGVVLCAIIGALVFFFVIRPRRTQRTVKDIEFVEVGTNVHEMMQSSDAVATGRSTKGKGNDLSLQEDLLPASQKGRESSGKNDDDLGPMLASVVSHGGFDYTVVEEDDEGFYDAEGYYHYYED